MSQCYLLGHPVTSRMTFVSMFWDENLTYICKLPLGALKPTFPGGGGARQYWSDKKTHKQIVLIIQRSTIVILCIIA